MSAPAGVLNSSVCSQRLPSWPAQAAMLASVASMRWGFHNARMRAVRPIAPNTYVESGIFLVMGSSVEQRLDTKALPHERRKQAIELLRVGGLEGGRPFDRL